MRSSEELCKSVQTSGLDTLAKSIPERQDHDRPLPLGVGARGRPGVWPGPLLQEGNSQGLGCREYLEHGLEYPDEVLEATAAYKSESDKVEQFLAECCVRGDGFSARARPLYLEFCKWAEGTSGSPRRHSAAVWLKKGSRNNTRIAATFTWDLPHCVWKTGDHLKLIPEGF